MDGSAFDSELPGDVRAFLSSCIDSVDQIDLLMRLRRAGVEQSVRDLADETGLPPVVIRHHLETLTARGLLRADPSGPAKRVTYLYAPQSADLARFGELAAEYYGASRQTVVRFIAGASPTV